MSLTDRLFGVTTLLNAFSSKNYWGSGFFYRQLNENNTQGNWIEIKDFWLVTNRHLLVYGEKKDQRIADSFTFRVRHVNDDKTVRWNEINLNREELINRTRLHTDDEVDIAAIRISDYILQYFDQSPTNMVNEYGVTKKQLAGSNKIKIEVSDGVLIIGYPNRYYDKLNLFPIVKSGIVASMWGRNFNGEPCFLIDARLFPGSSGSLVVSKPMDTVIDEGKAYYSAEKQFAFLGIYSANLEDKDDLYNYDIGKVWYGHLVEDIIQNGRSWTKSF